MRDGVREALSHCLPVTAIPPELVRKYALAPLGETYRAVHNPQTLAEKDRAAARIALEEYFVLISAFKFIKGGK